MKKKKKEKKRQKKACSIYDLSAGGVFVNVDFDVLGHPEIIQEKGSPANLVERILQ